MSRFSTFQEMFHTYDVGSAKGLSELLETILLDQRNTSSNSQELEQIYDNILSMENQVPQLDIER